MQSDQPRVLVLSDLWGFRKNDWQHYYKTLGSPSYGMTFLDSTIIAGISNTIHQQDDLHTKFVNGGIDLAVDYLCNKKEAFDTLIGLSIGGTIAWKAMLRGLKVKKLIGISATRLRYETHKPKGDLHLYYGGEDEYTPANTWFQHMNIEPVILPGKGHDIYKDQSVVNEILKGI